MGDITSTRPASGAPIATAWGAEIHDAIEGIQSGTGSGTMPGAGSGILATVTFPRPYAVPPIVTASRTSSTGTAPKVNVWAFNVTATTFQVAAATGDATTSSASIGFSWIAVGTPA